MTAQKPRHVRIAIIGAGFGGIGMAVRLTQQGEKNFIILEQAAGVGGTWWVNRYPGCACDVPSHLYSFSFEPNPDWSQRFAPRKEIQAYLEHCIGRYQLDPYLQLNFGVQTMRWHESNQYWQITSQSGRMITADVIISAIGGLSRPAWPSIRGLDQFQGPLIHSQLWDDRIQLKGQHVAVIGTGASAVQLIPGLASQVHKLDVYQRTPNWILPRSDRPIRTCLQTIYRHVPVLQTLIRFGIWLKAEFRVPGLIWTNKLTWAHRRLARRHLKRQVPDAELRKKLTPDYHIGCKRVLLSSDYYPVFTSERVELISTPINRIEADAIVDHEGHRRVTDCLVLATGFQATEPIPEGLVIGRNGQELHAIWSQGPQAYRGTCIAGFPNLFMLLGPNTALGHNSVIVMIEAQIRHTLKALEYMRKHQHAVIEVAPAAQRQFNLKLQQKLAGSVWNKGGCRSWYLHPESGLNTTLWPDFTWRYRRMMNRFEPVHYRFESPGQAESKRSTHQ